VLDLVVSFLAPGVPGPLAHPGSIIWMDPLPHSFPAREALLRIKPPDSVALLRPIERRCLVEGPGTGVAQPLCFGQIGFAFT
jgi:hypothetical protein